MLAPIFSGEYEGVDNIILTSKYGKTKCATAKVVAGIITAILTTTLIAAFNLLLAFVFMEQKGWIAVFYLPPVTMWKRLSLLISPAVRCSNIKFCWHLPVRLALRELHCSYLQSVKSDCSFGCGDGNFSFSRFAADHRSKSIVPIGWTSSDLSCTGHFAPVGGTNE